MGHARSARASVLGEFFRSGSANAKDIPSVVGDLIPGDHLTKQPSYRSPHLGGVHYRFVWVNWAVTVAGCLVQINSALPMEREYKSVPHRRLSFPGMSSLRSVNRTGWVMLLRKCRVMMLRSNAVTIRMQKVTLPALFDLSVAAAG